MDMKHVKSSNIEAIGYHSSGVMHIRFKDGKTYHYTDVSEDQHKKLMGADSHGKFLHQHKLTGKPGHHPDHKPHQ